MPEMLQKVDRKLRERVFKRDGPYNGLGDLADMAKFESL